MKRAVLILGVLLLAGCDLPEPYSAIQSRQAIVTSYKTTDVIELPDRNGETPRALFVVRAKDGSVWLVHTDGNQIVTQTQLFAPLATP